MEQIQEIANQLGCAIENVIPQYVQMQITGYFIGVMLLFLITVICMVVASLDWKTDRLEGFGFAIGGAIGIFCFVFFVLAVFQLFMWISFPDMMFFKVVLS